MSNTKKTLEAPPEPAVAPDKPVEKDYHPRVYDRPMTPKEIADFLKVSPATIARRTKEGSIPYFRVGNQIRFLPGEVLASLIRERGNKK